MNLLTLNAGSSSIKYKLYQTTKNQLQIIIFGLIEGIGEKKGKWHHSGLSQTSQPHLFHDHLTAFEALASRLKADLPEEDIQGIAHRVVHGGELYSQPTLITKDVLANIQKLSQLAPLHNPINALGIELAIQYFPKAIQLALFDNGFHHTMPQTSYRYAIDQAIASKYAIRRYGFHGINHEYVARAAANHLNRPLSTCNLISLHLGNGASACLIKNGQSFDTSMGMTPLAGLIMGTRCGDIDPAIPLYLQEQGLSREAVDKLLNKQSGLKGIADDNDMRHLCERALMQDEQAILGIDMYVYSIQKMIGAYLSQTPNLDALIFTGGVGENAALIREKIIKPLEHFGLTIDPQKNDMKAKSACENIASNPLPILVIKGNEEQFMAEQLLARLAYK